MVNKKLKNSFLAIKLNKEEIKKALEQTFEEISVLEIKDGHIKAITPPGIAGQPDIKITEEGIKASLKEYLGAKNVLHLSVSDDEVYVVYEDNASVEDVYSCLDRILDDEIDGRFEGRVLKCIKYLRDVGFSAEFCKYFNFAAADVDAVYKKLSEEEILVLVKIARKTKMNCWFFVDNEGSIKDLESGNSMPLYKAINQLAEGLDCPENIQNCELTEKETEIWQRLLDWACDQ